MVVFVEQQSAIQIQTRTSGGSCRRATTSEIITNKNTNQQISTCACTCGVSCRATISDTIANTNTNQQIGTYVGAPGPVVVVVEQQSVIQLQIQLQISK